MLNFWTMTCILATWAVVVAHSADHHPTAPSQPPAAAPGGPAPGPSVDCSSLIYKMTDCLGFLLVGGADSKPEASCCSGFKEVVNADEECICKALKSSAQMGYDIDMKKAATLPSACGVKAPSLSTCMSTTPGASPVNPPSPKSPKPYVPSGAPVPVDHQAPAPSPSHSRAYTTTSSSFLVPLIIMVVSAAICYL